MLRCDISWMNISGGA
jgi:hypothetical protein